MKFANKLSLLLAALTASPLIDKRLDPDLVAMDRARTYEELLDAVKGSPR